MSATIEALGVTVSGKVTRRYDDANDTTALVVTEDQAREMYDALGPVLAFFEQHRQ